MNYASILYCDTANGIGCRTVLFVSGCRHHCKNCFNASTWSFQSGKPFDQSIINKILDSLQPSYIDGLSILGGEPMEPENQPDIFNLIQQVKDTYPEKTIWLYSGYTWEEIMGQTCSRTDLQNPDTNKSLSHTPLSMNILQHIDILVDGEYQEEKRNIRLEFRGSENQRILDVPQSLQQHKPILSKYMHIQIH